MGNFANTQGSLAFGRGLPYTGEVKDVNMTKKEDPTGDKVVGFCNGLDDLASEYLGNDWPPEIVGLGFLRTAINVLSAERRSAGRREQWAF